MGTVQIRSQIRCTGSSQASTTWPLRHTLGGCCDEGRPRGLRQLVHSRAAAVRGQPSSYLKSEGLVRISNFGHAKQSLAAFDVRTSFERGLIFLTLWTYQPEGGLHERSELLAGLTTLQVAGTASTAVSTLQAWFRHLERARSMNIAVPDNSLLIDRLDKM